MKAKSSMVKKNKPKDLIEPYKSKSGLNTMSQSGLSKVPASSVKTPAKPARKFKPKKMSKTNC